MASLFDAFKATVSDNVYTAPTTIPMVTPAQAGARGSWNGQQLENMALVARTYALDRNYEAAKRGDVGPAQTSPDIARPMVDGRHAASARILSAYQAKGLRPDAEVVGLIDQLDNLALSSQSISQMDNGWRADAVRRGMTEFDATTITQTEQSLLKRLSDRTRDVMPIDSEVLKGLQAEADLAIKQTDLGIHQLQFRGEQLNLMQAADKAAVEESLANARVALGNLSYTELSTMRERRQIPASVTQTQFDTIMAERADVAKKIAEAQSVLDPAKNNIWNPFAKDMKVESIIDNASRMIDPALLSAAIIQSDTDWATRIQNASGAANRGPQGKANQQPVDPSTARNGVQTVRIPGYNVEWPKPMALAALVKARAYQDELLNNGVSKDKALELNALQTSYVLEQNRISSFFDAAGFKFSAASPLLASMSERNKSISAALNANNAQVAKEQITAFSKANDDIIKSFIDGLNPKERAAATEVAMNGGIVNANSGTQYVVYNLTGKLNDEMQGKRPYQEVIRFLTAGLASADAKMAASKAGPQNATDAGTAQLNALLNSGSDTKQESDDQRQTRYETVVKQRAITVAAKNVFGQAVKLDLMAGAVRQALVNLAGGVQTRDDFRAQPPQLSVEQLAAVNMVGERFFGPRWQVQNTFAGEYNYLEKVPVGQATAQVEYTSFSKLLASLKVVDQQFVQQGLSDSFLQDVSQELTNEAKRSGRELAPSNLGQHSVLSVINTDGAMGFDYAPEHAMQAIVDNNAAQLREALRAEVVAPQLELTSIIAEQTPEQRDKMIEDETLREFKRINGDVPIDSVRPYISGRQTAPTANSYNGIKQRIIKQVERVAGGDMSAAKQLDIFSAINSMLSSGADAR